MSQCVPSWDLDESNTPSSRLIPLRSRVTSNNIAQEEPLLDYEVAELTWENGQIALHGLGPPRVPTTTTSTTTATTPGGGGGACKYALSHHWEKPRAGGTLESIVNQATACRADDEAVPWFGGGASTSSAAAAAEPAGHGGRGNNMDARVPCGGSHAQVASCSGRAARVPRSSCGGDVGMTSSMGSPEHNTNVNNNNAAAAATATTDDHDSVCHSRLQRESNDEDEEEDKKKGKSSVSTKRSRAAAIHNQSERKRRDKINQRMKTLQKLVPNSSKTDKASMLDEVIDYLKQLQAQVQMMSRMNIPAMMMQQQLQMSMMGQMGMGLGMGMDLNSMARPNIATMPQVLHPNPFMPMAAAGWDNGASIDPRLQPQMAPLLQDPLSAFFACQSQPMTTEAYGRLAAMYQQLHQQHPTSNSKT